MKVIVYVEGVSDKLAMEQLLSPLITRKMQTGVSIQFFEAPEGDRKLALMQKVPRKAAHILANQPESMVVALPDLYPLDKGSPHRNAAELQAIIHSTFSKALREYALQPYQRYQERFKVFCFKYDLEALILAAEEALALCLAVDQVNCTWRKPVEDQNNDYPPKRVVEDVFRQHGKHYRETQDAPLILGMSNYQQIAQACPQCFLPFIDFLEQVI